MRVPHTSRRSKFGFNMTPMIDVVFLLIIFFLVSSHLAQQESHLELPLPVADSGVAAGDDNSPRVVVNVRRDGSILLAGTQVTPDELGRRLGFERRRRAETLGTSEVESAASLEVRIRGDRRVPYRFVEPIMLAAFREQIYDVTFAVYRSKDVTP
jgi:biopolymer transport protein ExbD